MQGGSSAREWAEGRIVLVKGGSLQSPHSLALEDWRELAGAAAREGRIEVSGRPGQ